MQPFGTILLLLLSSAALVLLGHVFRLLRWEQFIRIYEYPQRRSLLRAMAGGYAVNLTTNIREGFVATIPSPGTLVALLLAPFAAARRRRG